MKYLPNVKESIPIYIVENWISFIDEQRTELSYANRRVIDLIELFFGNVETARVYIAQYTIRVTVRK